MATQWLGVVPAPERWRNYQRTRTRAIALVEKQLQSWDQSSRGEGAEVERRFVSADPPLAGQIDRIEASDGRVIIVDLKSAAASGTDMPAPYRTQLLIYAALLLAADGRRATEVAIQYLDGSRQTVEVDWKEVESVVESTLMLRAVLNTAAAGASAEIPANPSPETCRYCAFQVVCPAFQRTVDPDIRLGLGFMAGTVESTSPLTGTAQLRREPAASRDWPMRLISPPVVGRLQLGDEVSLARIRVSSSGMDIRTTWESVAVIWHSGRPRIGLPTSRAAIPNTYAGEAEEVAASLGSG
jgi:CRISPR/Cas system-associated exonuclease Cas4 (RecB family)